ncbi:MAG: [Solobacterium sp.]|nr:[FeFe] hydrogenase H-cluster radical SAM maturase HydE [Solobacterium sp.]
MKQTERIEQLFAEGTLPRDELRRLIAERDAESAEELFAKARIRKEENFGKNVYLRGLIEFSSYCRNDCYYCGLRRSNTKAERYHLSKEEILTCARQGYELGFRTIVLQSGEDLSYSDEDIADIVRSIKREMPDTAVTLSIGEKTYEQYLLYYNAGADRYLLRHETADPIHYSRLHPSELTLENRKRCLCDLKKIGYQVGAGMMVEAPYQTLDNLVDDLFFLKELQPHMVGMGPFIAHKDTPFHAMPSGGSELTIYLLAIVRLMLPKVLLPATTALGTIDPYGREKGILAGANVIMPNLSPKNVRGKYMLYDGKISTGEEAAESIEKMKARMEAIGCHVHQGRGDAPGMGPRDM